MKYFTNISSVILVTVGIITLSRGEMKKAVAVGCDTYARITGDIGRCTGGSTEYSRERWLERYSVCLRQQLSREIDVYDDKVAAYYAEWNADSEKNRDLETITFRDKNIQPISISQMESSTYRANAELCN